MKIRIASAWACIGLMAFVSCSQDIDIETGMEENDGISKAIVSSCDFEASADYGQPDTRSTLDPTGTATTFAWAEGDKIGVYAGDGDGMMNFNLSHMADNKKEAIFKATGFNLMGGKTYYAFSPYDGNSDDKTQVEVNYDGIRQVTNGGYAHLGKYDYQWAKATALGSMEAANIEFNFKHAGAICRFRINNLPQGVAFDKMTISNYYIITKGTMNLTQATPTIVKATTGNSNIQTVMLGAEDGSGITVGSDGKLTVYTMMAPVDLSGKTIAVSLYEKGKSASTYLVSGKNMQAGGAHGFSTSGDYVDLGVTDGAGKAIMWARYNAAIPSAGNSYTSFFNHADAVDAGTAVWKNKWGGSWRLPSKAHFEALKKQTYSVWVTEYNGVAVSGRIFYKVKNEAHKGKNDKTSDDYDYAIDTDVHIFLPAAYNTGHGIYWTSDADTENTGKSHYFDIYNAEPYYFSTGSNTEMFSVRPVFTQN